MKLGHPAYPNITLENLLRRRKTNLARFIESSGITTYEFLIERCQRMGVTAPARETFDKLVTAPVSSPAEGVVVVPPPEFTAENSDTGPVELAVLSDPYPPESRKKNRRNR